MKMSDLQKQIREMVLELFQALERNSEFNPMGGGKDALEVMKGIEDGSFFLLPVDVHCNKLGWLNGAFFGRGERGIPLLMAGLLPAQFDEIFNDLLHRYWKLVNYRND
jgi:hypothetical protein